jgi:serine/threonine-protein kinase RsbT
MKSTAELKPELVPDESELPHLQEVSPALTVRSAMTEKRVPIHGDGSIVAARHEGRVLALRLGFTSLAATMVATAISELARNILLYAGSGEIVLEALQRLGREGVGILAVDRGPGIGNVPRAMEDGFSTSGRMGLGLPGVRRLMDEFEVVSSAEAGTQVRAVKWKHPSRRP